MADLYKRLNTVYAFTSASGTTIYTVPGGMTTIVRKIVITNNSGNDALAKIRHKPSSVTATDDHNILAEVLLSDLDSGMDDAPFAMSAGDALVGYGDGSNAISISVYGMEIS